MEKIYSRTKTIQEDKVSGFCPGCMHSTVVKLIGEVLEELNVVDKAVMITGVGCCGLHMDYIAYDTITSPHGPCELSDGTLLWVGTVYDTDSAIKNGENTIRAYKINTTDGSMEYVGEIENIDLDGTVPHSCEPHAVQTADGTIIAHIRVQMSGVFTVYQSESNDLGKTWTAPHAVLDILGGSPAHLLCTKDGTLVSTYGYRKQDPY